MKVLAALVLSSVLLGAAPVQTAEPLPANSTLYFDGMPPTRYQGNARVVIHTVDNLNEVCGQPPPGKFWQGCVRGITVFMPNPCPSGAHQEYARILCHEFAHIRGWPAKHGE